MVKNNKKKNLSHYIANQFSSNLSLLVLVATVSTLLLGTVISLHVWGDVPISDLTRDIAAVGQLPVYTGFLSQAGIFFWAASAMVCFFSAAVLPAHYVGYRKIRRFLLVSALLTLMLGLDDAFLLHESVFPKLGISSKVVYASYGSFLFFYLFRYSTIILKTDYALITIALIFFSTSIGVDMLDLPSQRGFLFEDGAKLVGIISWLAYFFQTGKRFIQPTTDKQKASLDPDHGDISSQEVNYG